jgi:hypothetical protein
VSSQSIARRPHVWLQAAVERPVFLIARKTRVRFQQQQMRDVTHPRQFARGHLALYHGTHDAVQLDGVVVVVDPGQAVALGLPDRAAEFYRSAQQLGELGRDGRVVDVAEDAAADGFRGEAGAELDEEQRLR